MRQSLEYNMVEYGCERKRVVGELKHTVFFGKYKHSPEYLGQLSKSPTDTEADLVYSRDNDHKLVIIRYTSDKKKREVLHRLKGHVAHVTVVRALAPNRVISADASGMLILWNLDRPKEPTIMAKAHEDSITDIQVLDENRFVTVGLDSRIKIWAVDQFVQKKEYVDLLVTKNPIHALYILNENDFLFAEREDDPNEKEGYITFKIFYINRQNNIQKELKSHSLNKRNENDPVSQIQLLPNGDLTVINRGTDSCHLCSDFSRESHRFRGNQQSLLPSGRVITWENSHKNAQIVVYELPYRTCSL